MPMNVALLNSIAALLGVVAGALCAWATWRLRATTLAAPCAWASASLLLLTADVVSTLLGGSGSDTLPAAHFDYLAGITCVAPFVALLGGKRPQNVAWQWIVLSLVGLLAFQDLRSWSIDAVAPSPHAAWRWLLGVIVVVQLFNYLPTRYAAAALLTSLGQICLLADYLPFMQGTPRWSFSLGLVLISSAILLTFLSTGWQRRPEDTRQAAWLDFRDSFGVLWALRVAERVNALAVERHSALRLGWYGLRIVDGDESSRPSLASPEADRMWRVLRSVLARFVSEEWLK
jgi:hypothetical protein